MCVFGTVEVEKAAAGTNTAGEVVRLTICRRTGKCSARIRKTSLQSFVSWSCESQMSRTCECTWKTIWQQQLAQVAGEEREIGVCAPGLAWNCSEVTNERQVSYQRNVVRED